MYFLSYILSRFKRAPKPEVEPRSALHLLHKQEVEWVLVIDYHSRTPPMDFDEFLKCAVDRIPQGRARDALLYTPFGHIGFSVSRGTNKLGFQRTSRCSNLLLAAIAFAATGLKDHDKFKVDDKEWELRLSRIEIGTGFTSAFSRYWNPATGDLTDAFYEALSKEESNAQGRNRN